MGSIPLEQLAIRLMVPLGATVVIVAFLLAGNPVLL